MADFCKQCADELNLSNEDLMGINKRR